MHLKTLLAMIALCGLVAGCGGGDGKTASQNPPLLSGQQLTDEVERFRGAQGLPGLAVVMIDGDRIEAATSGRQRIDAPDPIQKGDAFEIGSLTKAFTSTLIARLVEQKKLRWDSTLSEIFPAWRTQIKPEYLAVTVEQLLRHRSGIAPLHSGDEIVAQLPSIQALLTGDVRNDRSAAALWLLQQAPRFTPGSKFEYSNAGYVLAGLIAEAAGGAGYETLLTQEVLSPLQIHGGFGFPEDGGPGTPAGHAWDGKKWQVIQRTPSESYLWSLLNAAGGLNLSVPDYGRFLKSQLDGLAGRSTYLSQATFQKMHTPIDGYGLGWGVGDFPGVGTLSAHNGAEPGYYSTNRLIPSQGRAVEISCNCDAMDSAAATQIEQFANSLLKLTASP